MSTLLEWDRALFLWLNGLHTSWLDQPMVLISSRFVWVPFYLLVIAVIVWRQRKHSIWTLVFLVGAVVLSDQITSSVMKPFFERLRPCHDMSIAHLVHLVDGCGAKFGFASSHAANTFALATFLVLLNPGKNWLFFALFGWAGIVSYSRIYLGVHYPGDLLAGAIVGSAISYLLYTAGMKWHLLKHI